jgi:hypothetical protein
MIRVVSFPNASGLALKHLGKIIYRATELLLFLKQEGSKNKALLPLYLLIKRLSNDVIPFSVW